MHGRGHEEKRRNRHMWTDTSRASLSVKVVVDHSASSSSLQFLSCSPNSFPKDGRKITLGDCVLFQPPQGCPPFVGISRSSAAIKENQLSLSVSRLYRPAEVKLGNSILLEAVPN